MSPDFSEQIRSKLVRSEAAAMRFRAAFARLRTKAGFNPNQPRVPAGNPDGGQWTDTGASRGSSAAGRAGGRSRTSALTRPDRTRVIQDRTGENPWSSFAERRRRSDGKLVSRTVTNRDGSQIVSEPLSSYSERNTVALKDGSRFVFENDGDTLRVFDGKGRLVSEAVWTPDGPQPQPIVMPAYYIDSRIAKELREASATLLNWLSSLNDSGAVAVATFNATQFLNRDGRELRAEWIGDRTFEEIEQICKKFGLVRELADKAAADSPRQSYRSASARGTDIHLKVKNEIDELDDKNFRAELSILKATEDRRATISDYGVRDTIRIDVFERLGNVVCVYDLKTGNRGLSGARIDEIADNVFGVFPETQQILILEVRPRGEPNK